jgi:chemotaxis protein MotB
MEKALRELEERKAQADARIAEFRSLLSRFKSLIDAGKLKVKIAYGRMVVELATDILFAPGSADLSPAGKTAIGEVAQVLAGIPEREFQVEGHTDNVPIKTSQYPSNWELASARALTVVKAMVESGLPPDRVSAASYADWKPIAPNDTPEGRASNRRIEIVVVPDLSSLPGFDELGKVTE